MSGIKNTPAVESKQQVTEPKSDRDVSISHEPINTKYMDKSPPLLEQPITDRAVKSSTDSRAETHYDQAMSAIDEGNYVKAFRLFQQAAAEGSLEAKLWINGKKEVSLTPKEIITKVPVVMSQRPVLNKIMEFLKKLQETNKAYNAETVEKILTDLEDGHCFGFAVLYAQLALERDNGNDLTHHYFEMMSKIINWDGTVFEPPEGFSYPNYRAGDKQGLTPEQEKHMLLTDDIKQFIQRLRFAQQNFHEAKEWAQPAPQQDELKKNKLLTDIPLRNQKKLQGIIGSQYKTKNSLSTKSDTSGPFSTFSLALSSNLNEDNVAILTFPTNDVNNPSHTVSVILREGNYYLMDPNLTSTEEGYDFRYCGIPHARPEDLLKTIEAGYMLSEEGNIHGLFKLSYIHNHDTPILSIGRKDLRAHQSIQQISELYNSIGKDLFDRAFPHDQTQFSLSNEIALEIYNKDYYAFNLLPQSNNPDLGLQEIDCTEINLTISQYVTLILNHPHITFIAPDQQKTSQAYYVIASYYRSGDFSQDISKNLKKSADFFRKAKDLGHLDADKQLAAVKREMDKLIQNN